jgi:hypothetical protein
MPSRVSISELLAAGVRIRPAEAAAIVAEVCSRITQGALRGVPSIHVLRVTESGELCADGPITAHRATVSRAAQLLDDLMAPPDAAPEFRAPGPMRLALLRARGSVDLPPFTGLDGFAAAIARFAPADRATAMRELYARWENAAPVEEPVEEADTEPAEPAPASLVPVRASGTELRELTISDIRRARRATGMTLREVADRSRIPPALLRELEWGYLWNWPGGLYGRTQLVRYARAANLDERLVVDVAWPMLQIVMDARGGDAVRLIPAEESIDVLVRASDAEAGPPALRALSAGDEPPRRRGAGFALAAAAAAAIIVSPAAFWLHSHEFTRPESRAAASAAPAEDVVLPTVPSRGAQDSSVHAQAPTRTPTLEKAPTRVNAADADTAERGAHTVPATVVGPAFSSEGGAVFFTDDDEAGAHSALVRSGGAPRGPVLKITRVLDDSSRNFHAQPSPDGTRIAFDSDREGTRGVFVADNTGHNVHRISGEGFAAVPSWSPDGSRVAFVKADADHPDVWNLWVADLTTGRERQVTFNTSGQPLGGSWFPNGHEIAYSRGDAIVVQDIDVDAVRTFRAPVANRELGTPAVSPDGRHIIFQVARDGAWLLNLANGSVRKVLDDPTAEEYTWAPDGHRVAFHSRRSGGWNVWVMGG